MEEKKISRFDAYYCMKQSEKVWCAWLENDYLQRFTSSGIWQFSANNGQTWMDYGKISSFLTNENPTGDANQKMDFVLSFDPDGIYRQYSLLEKYKHMEEIV